MSLSTQDIELAVVQHLDVRRNLIVPNVSWAISWMQGREADLLVVTPARALWEIEIKTSLADVRRERHKPHRREEDKRIARLYYAIPESLVESALPIIREWAGVLAVNETTHGVTVSRSPKASRTEYRADDKTVNRLRDLCMMRMWKLKAAVHDMAKNSEYLQAKLDQARGGESGIACEVLGFEEELGGQTIRLRLDPPRIVPGEQLRAGDAVVVSKTGE